jgi:fermentation-respiration switch protein FrsA (DUF1100 family)
MKKFLKTIASVSVIGGLLVGCSQNNLNINKERNMQNIVNGKNSVTFKSQGVKLAGDLFVPSDFDKSKKYPAVVFSGPFNQIKEQTGAVYAKKLIQKGYVVLVFDHLGYGDSEGELRDNENAFIKMESIRDSISYLGTIPFVDKEKLYGLGVCASGGYVPLVAVTDKRLKAIATVSGMMDNKSFYFTNMPKEMLMPLFKTANEARQRAYESGTVEYYDALNMENTPKDNEGYDYYMTSRAGKQTYPNYSHLAPKFLMENAPLTSAVDYAPYLYTPYLGIVGEQTLPKEGETPNMLHTGPLTTSFYDKASEPKELYVIDGATHVSLYDIDKDVSRAVDKMDEFFKKY